MQEKWPADVPTDKALSEARTDNWFSISIGGIITAGILATGAAAFFATNREIEDAVDMAVQLEPVLGQSAETFFGFGFMAAGLTSAITAPLAAAYAVSGVLGWERNMRSWKFRGVWMTVLAVGVVLTLVGTSPVSLILVTQYAAGLSLPVLAIFLIVVMNRKDILKRYTNGIISNILGAAVVLIVALLGAMEILGLL